MYFKTWTIRKCSLRICWNQGTVDVTLFYSPFIAWYVRFTSVPFEPNCLIKIEEEIYSAKNWLFNFSTKLTLGWIQSKLSCFHIEKRCYFSQCYSNWGFRCKAVNMIYQIFLNGGLFEMTCTVPLTSFVLAWLSSSCLVYWDGLKSSRIL